MNIDAYFRRNPAARYIDSSTLRLHALRTRNAHEVEFFSKYDIRFFRPATNCPRHLGEVNVDDMLPIIRCAIADAASYGARYVRLSNYDPENSFAIYNYLYIHAAILVTV